ncbi:MAG TPA: hypothetical protein PK910_02205 [Bacteroidales bacterium]|nr:hypothetical protein [Bacteroidales bacterium]HRC88822.1 hypothetical protein [Bacteroidales bacterium]
MKKISKLHINQDKIMKNEELLVLQGGYGTCYGCYNIYGQLLGPFYGCCLFQEEAVFVCNTYYPGTAFAVEGVCN